MNSVSGLRALFATVIILVVTGCMWGQKPGGNTVPKYDPANEVKVKGTVEDVKIVPGASEGMHLMLKSPEQSILVHIAPEKFLKEMETEFGKGDELEIVGCKIKAEDGSDELLARLVTKNGNELLLRDKKGTPLWMSWGPGKK